MKIELKKVIGTLYSCSAATSCQFILLSIDREYLWASSSTYQRPYYSRAGWFEYSITGTGVNKRYIL
jgi:hypothetical protein